MSPYVPARPCTHPGCGVAVRGGGPCSKHAADKHAYTHTTDGRDRVAVRRVYGTSEWKRIRAAILARRPVCVGCGGTARVVHHIVPVSDGGTHAAGNLVALCDVCHQRRHKDLDRRRNVC